MRLPAIHKRIKRESYLPKQPELPLSVYELIGFRTYNPQAVFSINLNENTNR